MKCLLDTHALIWQLSSQEHKLPRDLRDSLRYCEDVFFASEISLIEIIQLQQGGKINFNYSPGAVREVIEQNNIILLPVSSDILETFYRLPVPVINGKSHSDPFDRIIIATALRRNLMLASADQKFPWYADNCALQLRQL